MPRSGNPAVPARRYYRSFRPPVHLEGCDEEGRLCRDQTELVGRSINSRQDEGFHAPCTCCWPGKLSCNINRISRSSKVVSSNSVRCSHQWGFVFNTSIKLLKSTCYFPPKCFALNPLCIISINSIFSMLQTLTILPVFNGMVMSALSLCSLSYFYLCS